MKQNKKLCNKVVIQKGITKEQELERENMIDEIWKLQDKKPMRISEMIELGIEKGIQEERQRILKIIEEHIIDDDYMGMDTKQSLKELKRKIQEKDEILLGLP